MINSTSLNEVHYVDPTLIMSFNVLPSKKSRATAVTSDKVIKLLSYCILIPQVRPAHKYPWEMIHLPGGDNAVCM
jgi:hypothetical protein